MESEPEEKAEETPHKFFTPAMLAMSLPYTVSGPNRLAVTVKQLLDAASETTPDGRIFVGPSAVYTVQVCGILQWIEQDEDKTSYMIYDGTGSLHAVAWCNGMSGQTELSGASIGAYYMITGTICARDGSIRLSTLRARKVDNYNEITEHFLSAIQESLDLIRRLHELANKPETIEWAKKKVCKSAIRTLLRNKQTGVGLTSRRLCEELNISPTTIRESILEMVNDGEVYTTISYSHYKLAD